MNILPNGIRMTNDLLRLPVGLKLAAKQEVSVKSDEVLLASIARVYPELIVIASEPRGGRT